MTNCSKCEQPIQPGQLFKYDTKTKTSAHARCPVAEQKGLLGDDDEPLAVDTDANYPD